MPTGSRRQWLIGASAALAAPRLLTSAGAANPLVVTPGQTEGPFYPVKFPADMDADFVRVSGQANRPRAKSRTSGPRPRSPRRDRARRHGRDLAVRCAGQLRSPRRLRPHAPRCGLPGLRPHPGRCRRPLRLSHHSPRRLSGPHAAYPLQGARARGRPPHDADVRRRRAPERHATAPSTASATARPATL